MRYAYLVGFHERDGVRTPLTPGGREIEPSAVKPALDLKICRAPGEIGEHRQ